MKKCCNCDLGMFSQDITPDFPGDPDHYYVCGNPACQSSQFYQSSEQRYREPGNPVERLNMVNEDDVLDWDFALTDVPAVKTGKINENRDKKHQEDIEEAFYLVEVVKGMLSDDSFDNLPDKPTISEKIKMRFRSLNRQIKNKDLKINRLLELIYIQKKEVEHLKWQLAKTRASKR